VTGQTVLLVLAVLTVSFSAPLIRIADAPALAVAFWRTAFAAIVLSPFAISKRSEFRGLSRGDRIAAIASGSLLAIHFASWIASVDLTTVASSALLVASQPIFVAIGSLLFLQERISGRTWTGIAIAIGGGLLIAAEDLGGSSSLRGDLLAVVGAVSAAGYLLIGRNLRSKLSLMPYVVSVYGICAVILSIAIAATSTPLVGFDALTWGAIAAIAVGPQLFGHTTFNLLLRRIDASKVAVAIMGEPVGSALLAMMLFDEIPGWLVIPGSLLLLAGIALCLIGDKDPKDRAPAG